MDNTKFCVKQRINMRWLGKVGFRFLKEQTGFSLIETIIAVSILAFIGVVFLSALITISKSIYLYEQRVTAQSLVQSQIEIIKETQYDYEFPYYDNVSAPASVPPGYQILISTSDNGTGRQEITVAVIKDGRHLFELETVKADWR